MTVNGVAEALGVEEAAQVERLGDVLYARLAEMLNEMTFTPGSRLPSESTLAERFKVSRPLVREALSRLRESGIVTSRKGAGSFLQRKPHSAAEVVGLNFAPTSNLAQVKKGYEFRLGVEGEAAFWAAQHRTRETLARIRISLDMLEQAIRQRALGVDADYEFHLAIARASTNEFFETVMTSMRTPIMFAINLSRSLSLARPLDRLRTVQAEHVAIFEAIEAGHREAASAAMRQHIGNTCNRVFEGSVAQYGGPLLP